MPITKNDIALIIVAFSLLSAIIFVAWGAAKGLLLDDDIQMTVEQFNTLFGFVFGILIGAGITYLGIRAGQANGSAVAQT